MTCTAKPFQTANAAHQASNQAHDGPAHAYLCHCGSWHVGLSPRELLKHKPSVIPFHAQAMWDDIEIEAGL